MTVSQYDHVVLYTDLGGRGYFGVNAALVFSITDKKNEKSLCKSGTLTHWPLGSVAVILE